MTTHDADNEYVLIDSTIVGADQHSTRAKKGGTDQCQAIRRSRGGLTTKTLRNWISKSNRMHKVGGPAALIGVQAGDVLLSTNGVAVKTSNRCAPPWRNRKNGGVCDLARRRPDFHADETGLKTGVKLGRKGASKLLFVPCKCSTQGKLLCRLALLGVDRVKTGCVSSPACPFACLAERKGTLEIFGI